MQTLLKQLKLNSVASNEAEIQDFLDQEYKSALNKGDLLGAGEWLASMLDYDCGMNTEQATAHVLALWSSPSEVPMFPETVKDLIANFSLFEVSNLAKALIALRARKTKRLHTDLADLGFKLSGAISDTFSIKADRPQEIIQQAEAKLNQGITDCLNALKSFKSSNCSSARTASVEVLRRYRALRPLVLRRENAFIGTVEALLGGGFREFTLSYEKGDMQRVIRQIHDVRRHASEAQLGEIGQNSTLWNLLVKPICEQLITLVEEANRTSRGAITPALSLTSRIYKTDLKSDAASVPITARLVNKGVGTAVDVRVVSDDEALTLESHERIELQPLADELVSFTFCPQGSSATRTIRLEWHCTDVLSEPYTFEEEITVAQQRTQPDWAQLIENPPYSINPIKKRSSLYGREAQLNDLLLSAASSTSTFLWGQKRVGKTSLLQVLQMELTKRPRHKCIYIRMGEIIGMHEGQFAHLLAARLTQGLPGPGTVSLPTEADFGAGAGRLIPFVEEVVSFYPDWRFLVIIDEFDDLDPTFYKGERGRSFIKALRSLSEIGLTFFFAGSERMSNIYQRHSLELKINGRTCI